MRTGSVCTGYGGLDLAVHEVLGGELAWAADIDPGASAILAHRFPGVPNLGDISKTDWSAVEPVDVLTAGFPCFVAGTMILTQRGYVPIETVTTADQVLTHTGRWRPVTSVMSRDDAPLWRVKAANPIVTTSEHPFYVRTQGRLWDNDRRRYARTFSDPAWMPASDLKPWTSRVGHVLPPVQQPEQGDGAWWWLCGRYLADGYRQRRTKTGAGNPVIGDQGRVVIACGGGKEEELRKQIALAGLHATEAQERTVIKFHIINQELYRFCEQFGSGASAKFLPASALSLPPDLAEHLLAGWLSGDGHQDSTGWHGTTTSKALALGMVMLAHRARGAVASLSLTVPPPTKVIEGRTVNQRPWWRVDIPFNSRRGLIDGDYAWRFVIGSEDLGVTGRVYNISVADDESYIADGVIVHNCQDVSCAGGRAGLREGNRTGVWAYVARAIDELRPSLVVLENVRGLLSAGADSDLESCPWCVGEAGNEHPLRALGAVLGDLADLGYDARWTVASAADAGAPHRRERVFILAWPAADAATADERRRWRTRSAQPGTEPGEPGWPQPEPDDSGKQSPADTERVGHGRHPGSTGEADALRPGSWTAAAGRGTSAKNTDRAAGGERWQPAPGQAPGGRSWADASGSGGVPAAAYAGGAGLEVGAVEPDRDERPAAERSGGDAPSDADGQDAGPHAGGSGEAAPAGPGDGPERRCEPGPGISGGAPADAPGVGHGHSGQEGQRRIPAAAVSGAPADAESLGDQDEPQRDHPAGQPFRAEPRPGDRTGGRDHATGTGEPGGSAGVVAWGAYEPAIRRWEAVLGRSAPRPTEPGRTGERLSPRFVEFLMGLPEGWVTDVPGLSRNAQLKALGNGVVPQQAAMALRLLLERSGLLPLVAADLTSAEGGEAA